MYGLLQIKEGTLPGHSCNVSGLMVRRDLFERGAVTKVSDLKGKKITSAEGQEYKLDRVLKMGNLTPGDVDVVSMDMASGVVAIRNGAVDAIDTTEPFVTQLLDDKGSSMLVLDLTLISEWRKNRNSVAPVSDREGSFLLHLLDIERRIPFVTHQYFDPEDEVPDIHQVVIHVTSFW